MLGGRGPLIFSLLIVADYTYIYYAGGKQSDSRHPPLVNVSGMMLVIGYAALSFFSTADNSLIKSNRLMDGLNF